MALSIALSTPPTKAAFVAPAQLSVRPTQAVAVGDPAEPILDADMWRAIMTGATVGTLGVFLLSFAMCMAAGVGVGNAAGVSLLPAFFGGVYAGGAPTLLKKMVRVEKKRIAAEPVQDAEDRQQSSSHTSSPSHASRPSRMAK